MTFRETYRWLRNMGHGRRSSFAIALVIRRRPVTYYDS